MTRRTRRGFGVSGLLAVVAVIALGPNAVGAAPAGRADSGTVYAAITHVVGGTAFVAGDATDKLLGTGATTFKLKVTKSTKAATYKATASVTGFEKNGSLSGSASTTEVVAPNGTVTSTGTLDFTHGAGGLSGRSFAGTVTGSAKSLAGPFVFHYKGIYR
jgi:hypothetical protein